MRSTAILSLIAGFFLLGVAACSFQNPPPVPVAPTTFFSSVHPSGPIVVPTVAPAAAATSEVATDAPGATDAEIARPSNAGGPGSALGLTGNAAAGQVVFETNCVRCHGQQGKGGVSNPGSDDGTVPPLNPIDSTLASTNYKTFAYNLDLFLEHGSTPSGPSPILSMPNWGDSGKLKPQQIADVIAYVISLNK